MPTMIQDAAGVSGEGSTILIVVGTGGFTHAAPLLEIGRILSSRGHAVHFATHQTQDRWLASTHYSYIQRIHLMGPPMSPNTEAQHYAQMQSTSPLRSFRSFSAPKFRVDAFWESDYIHLCKIVSDPSTRPDLILADFFVDMACRDIQRQYDIPLAVMWPQVPYSMPGLGVSYIPGPPGFQIDALTSEHASVWTRLRAAMRPFRAVPTMIEYLGWLKRVRKRIGVEYLLPFENKPNHLVLINSFWGLEVPRELPPLVACVGPVLGNSYVGLDEEKADDVGLKEFLDGRKRVVYVSFGTHVQVPKEDLWKILEALATLLESPTTSQSTKHQSASSTSTTSLGIIDGVAWAINSSQRLLFDPLLHSVLPGAQPTQNPVLVADILTNTHPKWHFVPFAPQRAVLAHSSTALFITHGGASSCQESLFHGTPMLCLGYFFDQPLNGLRIQEAGVGFSLDKLNFTVEEIITKARKVLVRGEGAEKVKANVERMKRIARVASRRKEHAADLVQELLFDHKYGGELNSDRVVESAEQVNGQESEVVEERWENARNMEAAVGNVIPSKTGNMSKKSSLLKKRRHMHLQTADMRMSMWRAKNWDIVFYSLVTASTIGVTGWVVWAGGMRYVNNQQT